MEIIIIGIVILIAGAVFIFCLTKLGGHSDSGASGKKTEKKSSGEKKAPKDKPPKDKVPKDEPPRDIPVKEPPIKPDSAPRTQGCAQRSAGSGAGDGYRELLQGGI